MGLKSIICSGSLGVFGRWALAPFFWGPIVLTYGAGYKIFVSWRDLYRKGPRSIGLGPLFFCFAVTPKKSCYCFK